VFDAVGKPIACQSIVGMKENGPWSGFQGFVVAPFSELEDDGYTVAVFFGREVQPSRFNFPFWEIDKWDSQHSRDLAIDGWPFLLQDNLWQKCPRVVFFRPNELVVQEFWRIETLAERVFPRKYHSVYGWPKGVSYTSLSYQCFRKDCPSVATRVALWNVWGSVYPIHVCDGCFSKTNGWCGDDLPELKKPLLLANGEPVTTQE
jgi:hypothetical protein